MMKIFKAIKRTILRTKLDKVDSFLDYSASEKAKIISHAVRESNKMQKELVEKYDGQFAA